MAKVKDPNYDRFVAPREERYADFKKRRADISSKRKELQKSHRAERDKLKAICNQKVQEGMTKKEAKAFVKPSIIILKDRYRSDKKELASERKEGRMVVFPFRLFYKPVAYNGSYLLKPQGKSFVILGILLVLLIFSVYMSEPTNIVFNPSQLGTIFSQLFGPQGGMSSIHTWGQWWGYMGNTAIPLIWDAPT